MPGLALPLTRLPLARPWTRCPPPSGIRPGFLDVHVDQVASRLVLIPAGLGHGPQPGPHSGVGPGKRRCLVSAQPLVHGGGFQPQPISDPFGSPPPRDPQPEDAPLGAPVQLTGRVVRPARPGRASRRCRVRGTAAPQRCAVVTDTPYRSAARRSDHRSSTMQRARRSRPFGLSGALACDIGDLRGVGIVLRQLHPPGGPPHVQQARLSPLLRSVHLDRCTARGTGITPGWSGLPRGSRCHRRRTHWGG